MGERPYQTRRFAMDDSKIVELYWERSEDAIRITQEQYGRYCYSIALSVLKIPEDAEECVNDAYVKTWNSIPPSRPERFAAFLGKITRNCAIDKYLFNKASRRNSHNDIIIGELEECIIDNGEDFTVDLERREIINSFLSSLSKTQRIVFMRRYWYMDSIADISDLTGLSKGNVKVILQRTRKKFKDHLETEGYN